MAMATSFFRVALSPLPLEGRGFGGGVRDVAMAMATPSLYKYEANWYAMLDSSSGLKGGKRSGGSKWRFSIARPCYCLAQRAERRKNDGFERDRRYAKSEKCFVKPSRIRHAPLNTYERRQEYRIILMYFS